MPQALFSPFPLLRSERLYLRELTIDDAHEIYELRSLPAMNKYIDRPLAVSIEEAHTFIRKIEKVIRTNESIYWAISLKNEPKLIGTICLWNFSEDHSVAELGYELHPDQQGKGIMTEALKKVLEYGFGVLQLKIIEAYTHWENMASIQLLERADFAMGSRKEDLLVYRKTADPSRIKI
ncbi:MAG: GNAT family N-acetyltransferase [Bacteroidia bacterium]